jgi:hypothetical protein
MGTNEIRIFYLNYYPKTFVQILPSNLKKKNQQRSVTDVILIINPKAMLYRISHEYLNLSNALIFRI